MTPIRTAAFAIMVSPSIAWAVPAQLAHQGRLVDASDIPIEGDHTMMFTLYDSSEAGEIIWQETLDVEFSNGYYSVILGSDEDDNPLDTDVLSQYPIFLDLAVDGGDPLEPRHEVLSVPFAVMADSSENVHGGIVNATEIRIDGELVITGDGTWTGESTEVTWDDITGVPEDLGDGDTTLSESEVLDFVTGSAIDLATGSTVGGVAISTGDHTVDTTLSESDIEGYVTDEAIDLAIGSTIAGEELATVAEVSTLLPSGMVAFFLSETCPGGWAEVPEMQGRFLVGLPSDGVAGATVGDELSDQQTLNLTDTLSHAHTVASTSFTVDTSGSTHSHSGDSHSHSIPALSGSTGSSGSHAHETRTSSVLGGGSCINPSNLGECNQVNGDTTSAGGHSHSVSTSPSTSGSSSSGGGSASTDHTHTGSIPEHSTTGAGVDSIDITMPYVQMLACMVP